MAKHPSSARLWTPADCNPAGDWMRFLAACRQGAGGKWRQVHYLTDIRLRDLRKMRDPRRRKAVGDIMVDRMITYCEPAGWYLEDLPWYTPQQLEEMGIWRPIDPPHYTIDPEPIPQSVDEFRERWADKRQEITEKANAQRALKAKRTTPPPQNIYLVMPPPVDDCPDDTQ